jgi:hypothetical protein
MVSRNQPNPNTEPALAGRTLPYFPAPNAGGSEERCGSEAEHAVLVGSACPSHLHLALVQKLVDHRLDVRVLVDRLQQ